jgi:hypothetical protein
LASSAGDLLPPTPPIALAAAYSALRPPYFTFRH